MNRVVRASWWLVCSLCALWPISARADSERVVDVELRPGVESSVHVRVRENTRQRGRCAGPTLAFVHGLAHTAASWDPLVDEIFASGRRGLSCKALLIDLPGHGASPSPSGMTFGELLIDDYVTAVIGTLDGLRRGGLRAHAIVGHSMGGLVVEGVQSRLLANGSSLARRYGIHFAALMSPSPAAEHPWQFADSGAASATVAAFVVPDPERGPVVRVDPATWSFFFFTNFSDQFNPATPSPATIEASGWNADEAAFAGSQLVGAPPFSRYAVGASPFAPRHGTVAVLINPSQDKFNVRAEAEAAYVQLTGDTHQRGFIPVDDEFAVHDMHVAEPRKYLRLALWGWLGSVR